MSRVAVSRLLGSLSKKKSSIHTRPFCSNVSANPPKEPIISSQSLLNDQSAVPPPPEFAEKKKSWNFLKFGIVGALTGAAGTAAYATYGIFFFSSSSVIFGWLESFCFDLDSWVFGQKWKLYVQNLLLEEELCMGLFGMIKRKEKKVPQNQI